jgi:MarR family transcriptional regulator, organic hydroperoxide resistance regulator
MTRPSDKARRRRLPVLLAEEELEARTFVQLARTLTRLEHRLEQELQANGLSLPQFDVLATLAQSEGLSQQELAERLLVTKGNICGMIDRMAASGWVERRPDPDDRRTNRLFLTRSGRSLLVKTFPQQHAALREVMSGLAANELQTLYHLLDRLEEGIGD